MKVHEGNSSLNVKYRGEVNLAPFECADIIHSSFVRRVCYDRSNITMRLARIGSFVVLWEKD
jgi:hypothetical protein